MTDHPIFPFSSIASADLSAKQFRFVKASGNGTVTVCAAATDFPVGVLQTAPKSGQAGSVAALGTSKVVAGGTVTAGQKVGSDANGAAVAKTAANDIVSGIALTGGAAGEVILVLLTLGCQRSN